MWNNSHSFRCNLPSHPPWTNTHLACPPLAQCAVNEPTFILYFWLSEGRSFSTWSQEDLHMCLSFMLVTLQSSYLSQYPSPLPCKELLEGSSSLLDQQVPRNPHTADAFGKCLVVINGWVHEYTISNSYESWIYNMGVTISKACCLPIAVCSLRERATHHDSIALTSRLYCANTMGMQSSYILMHDASPFHSQEAWILIWNALLLAAYQTYFFFALYQVNYYVTEPPSFFGFTKPLLLLSP